MGRLLTEQEKASLKPEGPWKPLTTDGAVQGEAGEGEPLHLVLDDIKDYAIFMVSLQGTIASWNIGAERLKGYTSQEAIGKPFATLFKKEDAAKGQPQHEMQEALKNGVYTSEGVRVRKDGSFFDADVTLRVIHDANGKPRGFVKVTRDITERKRWEKSLRERSDFEKELLGIVSHDLRNPLNAILLSATVLMQRGDLGPRQFQAVERIISSAQRATRLIRDLLDFTQGRLGNGLAVRRESFELNEFVRQVIEEIRVVHPGRQIDVEASGEIMVEWDPDRTAQLLVNLVTNALKHGSKDERVRVSVVHSEDTVEIEIHNLGEPIPAQLIGRIFERLTQGSQGSQTGSIGLGLFIVKLIVAAHRGKIEVQSTREHGTSFRIQIPRTAERAAASQ